MFHRYVFKYMSKKEKNNIQTSSYNVIIKKEKLIYIKNLTDITQMCAADFQVRK